MWPRWTQMLHGTDTDRFLDGVQTVESVTDSQQFNVASETPAWNNAYKVYPTGDITN